jgi:GH24 family phage-related lysozyme (muramidase)
MNVKKIIKEELKKQNIRNQEINECVNVLKNLFMKYSLINENEWLKDEPSPTYKWEIPKKEKEEINNSSKWVKTKEDVLEYVKVFIEEIKSLPKWVKRKFLKYVLYSFMGILSLSQISSLYNNIEKNDYKAFKTEIQSPIVKKEKIRKPSQTLFNHLKKEEGIKGKPVLYFYDLGDGAYTTGYGHAVFSDPSRGSTGGDYDFIPNHEDIIPYDKNEPDKEITRITKEQAEQLLQDDMLKASKGVNSILDKWVRKGIEPEITQGMYDAMVSIAYNHGVGNLRMTDFIQYVKRSEFKKAEEEIKNISSNMFDEYPGLKTRREKESKLFGKK